MIAPLGCSVMEVQRLKKNLEKIWKKKLGKSWTKSWVRSSHLNILIIYTGKLAIDKKAKRARSHSISIYFVINLYILNILFNSRCYIHLRWSCCMQMQGAKGAADIVFADPVPNPKYEFCNHVNFGGGSLRIKFCTVVLVRYPVTVFKRNQNAHHHLPIHSKSDSVCGIRFFSLQNSAEKVRKSRQQNFATKVRKS